MVLIKTPLENLSKHLQIEVNKNAQAYEYFVTSVPLSLVRELHDYELKTGFITQSIESTTSELPLAIMTFIAIGGGFGANLETVFPEYKNANPAYAKPNKK